MAEQMSYFCESCGENHTHYTTTHKVCGIKNQEKICTELHLLDEAKLPPPCPQCKQTKNMIFENKWVISPLQRLKIIDKLKDYPTYIRCFRPKHNITKQFFKELAHRCHGEQTNHIILFITGETGTFKSSIAQTIAAYTDHNFTVDKISFGNDELLEKISQTAKITQVGKEISQTYMRDETPKLLKQRADMEFQNLSETMRDSRINLVLIKPVTIDIEIAHYMIETIAMSEDYTQVKAAVLNPKTMKYLGWIILNVNLDNYCTHCKKLIRDPTIKQCPCGNKLTKNQLWKDYMTKKKEFQKIVAERKLGTMNFKENAQKIINHQYFKTRCYNTNKDGEIKIKKKNVSMLIRKTFPTFTINERSDILTTVEDIIFEEEIEGEQIQ